MKSKLLFLSLFTSFLGTAQTWSDDVASIVYNKCGKCHHTGGVGPMPLMTYNEASTMASAIQYTVTTDKMPPWPPDDYQQFVHDRSLTATEKTTILDWIANGTPQGNPANTPPPPVFSTGSVLGAGDLELTMPVYTSAATNFSDDYVCFAIPSGLTQDRIIKSIEIVPGNREIVHHALVYIDPTGASSTNTSGNCVAPNSTGAKLAMGYTPGSSPMTLPATAPLKLGIPMPIGSEVVLAMHYPAGSAGQQDSTKVIFHFYPPAETGIRQVYAEPVLENWTFNLPPNQITNVAAQYPASGGLATNISVLSVFPHMHLIGKNMRVYGINPSGDTLKMINIPKWDFEWQDFYFFKNIIPAPTGSYFRAEGSFDNTSSNPNNPNSPPQTIGPGLNTTDEMFLVYTHFMLYQNGDENYDIEALMDAETAAAITELSDNSELMVYPNPFDDRMTIELNSSYIGQKATLYIYDYSGKIIRKVMEGENLIHNKLEWDGLNEQGNAVSPGVYYLSVNINGNLMNRQLIKR